jgi:protein CpxP
VVGELKNIGSRLNLSDDQRQKVVTEASEKVQEYRNRIQIRLRQTSSRNWLTREAIRQRVVNILTAEQLTKWDEEVAKAKEFLGLKLATYSNLANNVSFF